MIAERAAIFAHASAERADLMIAGGIEQPGEDSQCCGDIVHRRLAVLFVICASIASLTRRANQGQIDIIAKNIWPAPGSRQRVFSLSRSKAEKSVSTSQVWSAAFSQNLTRRANHWHSDIIART